MHYHNVTISSEISKSKSDILFICASQQLVKNHSKVSKNFMWVSKVLKSIDNNLFSGEKGVTWTCSSSKRDFMIFNGYNEEEIKTFEDAVASSVRSAINKKLKTCEVMISPKSRQELQRAVDAAISASFTFSYLKNKKDPITIDLIIYNPTREIKGIDKEKLVSERKIVMDSVFRCRYLSDANADEIYPEALLDTAKEIVSKDSKISLKSWLGEELDVIKAPLIKAVGRGSDKKSLLMHLEYNENKKSLPHLVLIGKGVTYDTGGLNLKPGQSMEDMRKDMAGSAAVLSTIEAVSKLELPIRLSVIIPSAENSISNKSYKCGDVYEARSGAFVEIVNTDAEGRLILADAIDYAMKEVVSDKSKVVDLATLTGAILVALGPQCAGMFSNSDSLSKDLIKSGVYTGEYLWRMPLLKDLKETINSNRASIKNCGGRFGGSITAALFLEYFISKNIKWAHIDIAGSSDSSNSPMFNKCSVSGYGVRLLVDLAKRMD